MFIRVPLVSSQITEVAYDPNIREARVKFAGGSEYRYENVAEEDFVALKIAPSPGSQFAKFKKIYPGIKLEGAPDKDTAKANEAVHAQSLAALRELEKELIKSVLALQASIATEDWSKNDKQFLQALDNYKSHPLAIKLP